MEPAVTDRAALSADEQAILDRYARLLSVVPGAVSVWASTAEGHLHFHTLVPPGRHNLRAVFEAERTLLQEVNPLAVDFDIYQDPQVTRLMFPGQAPLYRSR
jgi:hypothetical protein